MPFLPSVPIVPLLPSKRKAYAMFEHFLRYPWVIDAVEYGNKFRDTLSANEGETVGWP